MKRVWSIALVRRRAVRAFTLVEMLAVIVIIGLLISILVPAVNSVRVAARNAATRSSLSVLGTGLETYRADTRLGGSYPFSASDRVPGGAGAAAAWTVKNPYRDLPNNGANDIKISGGGLLVWALAGADLLGTPGFKIFRTGAATKWADDTGAMVRTPRDQSDAYALDATTREAIQPRFGPYVDLTRVRVTRWNKDAQTANERGSFEIEAERKARGDQQIRRLYPVFLDPFGFPLLYYRADPSGTALADKDLPRSNDDPRGTYHWNDNAEFLFGANRQPETPAGSGDDLLLLAGADVHQLSWRGGTLPQFTPNGFNADDFGFARYIQNNDIQAKWAPKNADSYLLISAGPDGVYGTADDLANIEHNGR